MLYTRDATVLRIMFVASVSGEAYRTGGASGDGASESYHAAASPRLSRNTRRSPELSSLARAGAGVGDALGSRIS